MISPAKIPEKLAAGMAVALTALIFLADWWTPSVVNVSVFYACVIVLLLWANSLRWLWSGTAAVAALALFGLRADGIALAGGYLSVDAINRYITVGMLTGTAGFVHFNLLLARRFLAATGERQRAQESLRRTQDELAHASRVTMLGELGASIAHEISQPLSGVLMNANASLRWLAADPPQLDEARSAIGRIVRDGNLANAVVQRIRALMKKAPVAKTPLDLDGVVREVIALARAEADRKGVALRSDLHGSPPPILGDRVQLQQVLLNLILNGIEAMGSVEDRPRELGIRTQLQDGGVLVSVRDAGTGFGTVNADKVFESFYTTKEGGMGLGLSISRSIIENHEGRLWATANEGHGATFQFVIPAHHESPGARA